MIVLFYNKYLYECIIPKPISAVQVKITSNPGVFARYTIYLCIYNRVNKTNITLEPFI